MLRDKGFSPPKFEQTVPASLKSKTMLEAHHLFEEFPHSRTAREATAWARTVVPDLGSPLTLRLMPRPNASQLSAQSENRSSRENHTENVNIDGTHRRVVHGKINARTRIIAKLFVRGCSLQARFPHRIWQWSMNPPRRLRPEGTS